MYMYLEVVFQLNQRKAVRDAKSAVGIKNIPEMIFMLLFKM